MNKQIHHKTLSFHPICFAVFIFYLWYPFITFSQVIEKNYLTTDKDIYAPKDTIWFKGYAFNRENFLSDQSIAYRVWLIDESGNKLADTSWPINNGMTDGFLMAPRFEGSFKLIALSGQMIGAPAEQACSKDIFVRSELVDEIEILAFPQFEHFEPGKSNLIDVFTQHSPTRLAPKVKLIYKVFSNGLEVDKGKLRTNEKGKATLGLDKLKRLDGHLQILIESDDKTLSRPIKLAVPINTRGPIDLQFFPEGGQLISGVPNRVAFKALSSEAKPLDFKAVLLKDEVVQDTIQSFYQGMGSFVLVPDQSNYMVKIIEPALSDSLYALPATINEGVAISIVEGNEEKSLIRVIPHANNQDKPYQLVISQFEKQVVTFKAVASGRQFFPLPIDQLSSGVATITLMSQNGSHPIERLFFVKSDDELNVSIETNKPEYDPREKVEALISVTDTEGNPVQGNFSFSAIDLERAKSPISEQPNLLAQILLNSELKGQVPTPNFYFTDHPKANEALDHVMMTHGWRKYQPSDIEDPEGLMGSLYRMNNKKKRLAKREIQLVSLRSNEIVSFKLDTSEVFRIGSEYLKYRGDSFLIFSNKLSKKDKFSLIPDEGKRVAKESYTTILANLHGPNTRRKQVIYERNNKLRPDRFQNTLQLNSVVVQTRGQLPDDLCELTDYHFEHPWTTKMVDELDLTNNDIIELIKQVNPVVKGYSDEKMVMKIWMSFSDNPINKILHSVKSYDYVLDGIKGKLETGETVFFDIYINCDKIEVSPFYSFGDPANYYAKSTLDRIDFSNLESISINTNFSPLSIKDGTGRSLEDGMGEFLEGVKWPSIWLNTINDAVIYKPVFDMKFYHASYQNYTKEFYSPVYETEKQKKDPVPDLRTTIFWQANVFTDENGQARISFYNADRSNQIGITVEGVDAYSRMGYAQTTYKVLEGPLTEDDN